MAKSHPKRQFLQEAGALHLHPERVVAKLFQRDRFFDPVDKVQVKYEMLRAHAVEGQSVVAVAEEFGFSRETYYSTWAAFQDYGVPGLTDGKAGRPGLWKLTDEAVEWVATLHRREPRLSGREIAERLGLEFGIEVHRRTIERFAERCWKTKRLKPETRSRSSVCARAGPFSPQAARHKTVTSECAPTLSPRRRVGHASARLNSTCDVFSSSACSAWWAASGVQAHPTSSKSRSSR